MKKYNIWIEGYLVTGMEGIPQKANFVASVEANSFYEACCKHYKNDKDYNKNQLSVWGCRLFPTEIEARKSFG